MRAKNLLGAVAVGVLFLITGCADFFPSTKSSSSTSTATSGDYVYVADQTANELSEFSVGTGGALTAITGSPITLVSGLSAASVVVSRPNTFVYVGGVGTIVGYSIGTGGALTAISGGISATSANFISMDTSPDGNWLLALDSLSYAIRVYQINTSNGALTVGPSISIGPISGAGTMTPKALRIAPNGDYVAAALGTGGTVTFTFNTSNGAIAETSIGQYNANYVDNAVAFDTTSAYLWVARAGSTTSTSGIASFSVNSSAITTQIGSTVVASGDAPYALLVDSTGKYVYSANRSTGNVSGYSQSAGVLTALASSPFVSGSLATALAEDNTHDYVIAASFGGSSDLTVYGFDVLTGGKLNAVATSANGTGSTGSIALATTH